MNKEIELLFNYLKTNSTTSISNIGTLGLLLGQMGDYIKAKKYYQIMLDELPIDHSGVPIILNNIWILYSDSGNNKKALENYTKSYEGYKKRNVPENDLLFVNLYHIHFIPFSSLHGYMNEKNVRRTSITYQSAENAQKKTDHL